MKPYSRRLLSLSGNLASRIILVTVLVVTSAWGLSGRQKTDLEALTRNGWDHFYSLEYDHAIEDFQKVLNA
ncbi:MAG: hypothetical protein ACRD4F_05720, partial [Candidatus Angelobacter sp.]